GECLVLGSERRAANAEQALSSEHRAGSSQQPGSSGSARGSPIAAAPLQALRRPLQALADRCREGGVQTTWRLLGDPGDLLARYEPALRGLPGQESAVAPPLLPPEASRLRLFEVLAQTFEALAAEQPLLLVLDDLQWADELTIGFLEFWSRWSGMQRTH